ncbi:Kinesin-like protein kif3b [Crenichthys baileyi]|uniref:Kinesin-like protein n=1 Tax=Crenichthys baileyi TaxID=28760 RepID=A0AAV9S2B5_9TELE
MSKTKSSESVKVVVRCRPMNDKEKASKFNQVVSVDVKLGQIMVRNPREASELPKVFTFDSVYDCNSKQIDLYDETFRPLVDSVLLGFNGTIFAYGQTGTGKTYTMEGVRNDPERRGVIPNSFEHIFTHISRSQNQQYLVRASYLEIYQEEIRDLLSKDQSHRLELRERPDTGVYVKDLSSFVTKSVREIEHVMNVGNQNRSVGATNMNEHSSRSHAIFVITVECSELGMDGENHIRVGKLNLVDLAGSERQTKTGAQGERLKEATKINLSLSALGNVISALVDGRSSHIPYRDSKLTRLLQDSLGGNARTVMVANIGPASYNVEETLTTLRYANRAKNIKNKPHINEDPKDALLREFQEEIARLKDQLEKRVGKKKRRRQRRRAGEGSDGEDLEDAETEDDDEEGGDYWREQQDKLEREKKAILDDHSLVADEKDLLLREKEKKMEDLRREKEVGEMLAAKVKAMESKLLVGGKNIVDHTNEQQRMLELRRQEIAEQTYCSIWKSRFMPSSDHQMMSRPPSAVGYRRPLSHHAQIAMRMKPDMRYKAENILMLDMDLPARTTEEYQEPVIAPKVAAALEDALRDEDEIQVDASGFHSSLGPTLPASASGSLKKPKSGRPRTSKKSSTPTSPFSPCSPGSPLYPQSRGLVPK